MLKNRMTYNVDRCPYCESEKAARNESKMLHLLFSFFRLQHIKDQAFPSSFAFYRNIASHLPFYD